jgi:hypothetical protein
MAKIDAMVLKIKGLQKEREALDKKIMDAEKELLKNVKALSNPEKTIIKKPVTKKSDKK